MQSNASKQSSLRCPLNEIFASKGQVRLLRVLATEPTEPLPASEAAARSGTTESGARRILQRLVQTGLVEKTGDGRACQFAFRRDGLLAREIARLFEAAGPGEHLAQGFGVSGDPGEAVGAELPAGSVFKLTTALGALNEGVVIICNADRNPDKSPRAFGNLQCVFRGTTDDWRHHRCNLCRELAGISAAFPLGNYLEIVYLN